MKKILTLFIVGVFIFGSASFALWKFVPYEEVQKKGFDYYEAGYTNLTEFVAQTAWRIFYSNTDGDVTELALGASGTFLKSNGAAAAPTFATPAGSGDFLADGTVDMTGNFNINTQPIEDANSNELLTFVTAPSAVNNVQITNAATGDGVKVTAVGGDTNIDLHLEPKGIGSIRLEETLPSTAGQSLAEIIMDVDSSAQVSTSEYHAILAETTGTPAGVVAVIGTVGKIDVIRQRIATFATPSQTEFAGKKHTGGSAWIDGDTGGGAENLDAFEIFVVNSDEIYFGAAAQFDEVEVIMGTGATKNVNATFWYNTAADTWTQFFPEDGTDGFQQSGDIIWLLSGITGLWKNDGDPGAGDTTAGYWIKIIRTRVSDPGAPTPTTIKVGLATLYFWDKTGAIDALSVEGDTITEGGNAVWNDSETDVIKDTHIDWGSGATQVGTADITEDTDKNFVTDAESTVIGNTSGTNSGDNTVATTGDAAVDFFGAGVDAVTDTTTCTDIEGTGLSITAGTLNWSRSGTTFEKSFLITNVTATADGALWRVPAACTITAVHGVQVGGTNVIGHLTECDANGLNPAGVDGATDITILTTNVNDDGGLSNPTIDSGDYIGWRTTSVSGTITRCTLSFEGTWD